MYSYQGWNQKKPMLLEHLGCKITLWAGAVQCDPWWHEQGLLAARPGWLCLSPLFICHFKASRLQSSWHSSFSHVDTSCQLHMPAHTGMAATLSHWRWPERNHTFVAPKLRQNKIHTSSVAPSLQCCGLVLVLLSSHLPRTLLLLLVSKHEAQSKWGWEQPAHQPAFTPPSLPKGTFIFLFFFFLFPSGSTDLSFLTLISHHFPLIWLSFLHIIYSHRCL